MSEIAKLLIAVAIGLIGKIIWDWLINLKNAPAMKMHSAPCEYIKILEKELIHVREELDNIRIEMARQHDEAMKRMERIENFIMNGKLDWKLKNN